MDLMQIRGFHTIEGESRMPEITEDGKFPKWNNALGVFEYITIKESDDETYVSNVTQDTNTVTITRNDGIFWEIDLGIAEVDLDLPGDTMILFDEADSIGGRSNLTYDYTNHKVTLTDSQGIFGKAGVDASQSIVQYLGDSNLYLNFGEVKAIIGSMANNQSFGYNALASVTSGDGNIGIGPYAGDSVATDASHNIFIGEYAGRLEQGDYKLYIHSGLLTTAQEYVEQSLLYGDFSTGQLWINNRLDIREEVRIGTFDVANTPDGGMIQFVDAGSGLLKPQYYDETQWVDFANGLDSYLTAISNVGEEWTFEISGQSDIVVTIPNNYLTVAGSIYSIQSNDGAGDLAASDNFTFNPVTNVATLTGVLALENTTIGDYPLTEGMIQFDGEHIYIRIDGEYIQMDNDSSSSSGGRTSIGESIGDSVEVYAGFVNSRKVLQFYDLLGGPGISIDNADIHGDILFSLDYAVTGSSTGVGVDVYKDTTNTDSSAVINIKRLYSSDGSIIYTDEGDYINATVVGIGGGESNDGANVGTGEGRIYDEVNGKNGLLIPFRTIKQGTNTTVVTDTVTKIVTVDVPLIVTNAANIAGGDINWYKDSTDASGKRTLNFRPISGVNDIVVSLNGDVVEVGLDPTIAIPSLDGIILPVATDADKTLTWSINHDDDVRDATASILEDIVQLKLGSNIVYDPSTNTIDSIGAGDPLASIRNQTIVRNGDGTVDRVSSNRNVIYESSLGILKTWDGTSDSLNGLGWLAFENDYPVSSNVTQGIIQVDTSGLLAISNGILSINDTGIGVADPNKSIQWNNNGVFGGNSNFLYDSATDRIYLNNGTAANSALVFGLSDTDNTIYNLPEGVGGNHLYIDTTSNTSSSLRIVSDKISLGAADVASDSHVSMQDSSLQAKAYALKLIDWYGDTAIAVSNDSNIYTPNLSLATTDYVVYVDIVTGLLTYGPTPVADEYEDIAFEFADVTGAAQQYTLDIKASFSYNIINTILETDDSVSGTISGGGTAITYTNVGTIQEIGTSSYVASGSRIYLNLTAGHGATTIRGKLVISRT